MVYRWNKYNEFKPSKENDVVCAFDIFEGSVSEYWNIIRNNKDKIFYIQTKHIQKFQEMIPIDWDALQTNIRFLCPFDSYNSYMDLDIQHRYLIVSPLVTNIDLKGDITSNSFEHIVVLGNEEGNETCDYEWVLNIQRQCLERHISFTYYSTGNILVRDGKKYRIPIECQKEQALKANLNVSFDPWYEKDIFLRLSKSKFRSSFHLKTKEKDYINKITLEKIESHAHDLVRKRIGDAFIPNDGKQTPTKGHPVFIAQHATACCCRKCLKKWHNISSNKKLSKEEEDYIVNIIMTWIKNELK